MSLAIELRSLSVHRTTLIRDLSLDIPAGRVHTLMGDSGSGKSSLLAAVCGTLAEPLRFDGRITLDGTVLDGLPTSRRQVGILFQDDLLFAHMSVRENLLFAVPPGPPAAREGAVAQALHDLEMPDFGPADPATLSGGQRARVALMRALLARPKALLLDEPFSRLDMALRSRMREFVWRTVRGRAIPVLMVTHDDADIADPAHVTRLSTL